jgi:hypothetical protein
MLEDEVIVTDGTDCVSKTLIAGGIWVHPFVQNRDDKNTSQNSILELSCDTNSFYNIA